MRCTAPDVHDDAVSSAGYDQAAPDFLVTGPDELFETLHAGLASFSASQHNVGSDPRRAGRRPAISRLATITAHVLVTLLSNTTWTSPTHRDVPRRGGEAQRPLVGDEELRPVPDDRAGTHILPPPAS